jgi:uncharacterized protein (TIGR02996 family)
VTEAELLAAIQAAPDDDEPRLVYADWLTGEGALRGEHLQLAVRAEAEDDDDLRAAAELLASAHPEWTASLPLPEEGKVRTSRATIPSARARWSLRRGLPEALEVVSDAWPAFASAARAAAPLLRELTLRFESTSVNDGAIGAALQGLALRKLALVGASIRAATLGAAARACPRIVELVIEEATDKEIGTAIGASGLDGLRGLRIIGNRAALDALAHTKLPALRELDARFPGSPGAIVKWPARSQLTSLRVEGLADEGVRELFRARLEQIERFAIDGPVPSPVNAPGWAGQLVRLAGVPNVIDWPFARLRQLDLPSAAMSAELLASLPAFSGLERLRLRDVDVAGARAALVGPVWKDLAAIDLTSTRMAYGLHEALRASTLGNLRSLRLRGFGLPGVGAAIARNPAFANLRYVGLVDCMLAQADALELARSTELGVASIDLSGNGIRDEAAAKLRARFGDRVLL